MAADGASAENTYSHRGRVLLGDRRGGASFHKLATERNRICDQRHGREESDRSMLAGSAYCRPDNRKYRTKGSSMPAPPILWNLDERGVATVTLNRPEVNNAYDAGLIHGVLSAMDELGKKTQLRIVVLKGNGKHFQAGADLKWINAVRPQSPDENEAVSKATFEAVQRLNRLPVPTVALVQGGCFGGGTGVISRVRRGHRGRQRGVLDHGSSMGADGCDYHTA